MKRPFSPSRTLAAALLLALLVGAACAPAAQPTNKPAPTAAGKTELTFASKSDALTVNPLDAIVIIPDRQITNNLYDTLVELDADGNVVPSLATAWERLDPITIRLQLRQGVKFHGGQDFTAEDVRWTFEELVNADKKYKNASSVNIVERIDVIDPYTVNLVTKGPNSTAIRKLTR